MRDRDITILLEAVGFSDVRPATLTELKQRLAWAKRSQTIGNFDAYHNELAAIRDLLTGPLGPTGRPATSPNLQNMPTSRRATAEDIRQLFKPKLPPLTGLREGDVAAAPQGVMRPLVTWKDEGQYGPIGVYTPDQRDPVTGHPKPQPYDPDKEARWGTRADARQQAKALGADFQEY